MNFSTLLWLGMNLCGSLHTEIQNAIYAVVAYWFPIAKKIQIEKNWLNFSVEIQKWKMIVTFSGYEKEFCLPNFSQG